MADIENLRTRLQAAMLRNISHARALHERFELCEISKNDTCEFLLDLIHLIDEEVNSESKHYVDNVLDKVDDHLKGIERGMDDIDNYMNPGNSQGSYEQFRLKQISEFTSYNLAVRHDFLPIFTWFQQKDLLRKLELFPQLQAESSKYIEGMSENYLASQSYLSKIKSELDIITNHKAATNFKERADEHYLLQRNWLIASVACGVVLLIALFSSVASLQSSLEQGMLLQVTISKVMTLTLLGVFFRIFLSRYSVERNLYVIYRHRNNVLDLYRTDTSLDASPGSKDQLRLEIAKLIYSDPETGMVKTPSEFNFAPVMSAIEKSNS